MDSSSCMGLMAVVAVSGSVALLSFQMHRRLENEFRRRAELEIGMCDVHVDHLFNLLPPFEGSSRERCKKATTKKKVRFADDVVEPSSDNTKYRRRLSRPVGNTALVT